MCRALTHFCAHLRAPALSCLVRAQALAILLNAELVEPIVLISRSDGKLLHAGLAVVVSLAQLGAHEHVAEEGGLALLLDSLKAADSLLVDMALAGLHSIAAEPLCARQMRDAGAERALASVASHAAAHGEGAEGLRARAEAVLAQLHAGLARSAPADEMGPVSSSEGRHSHVLEHARAPPLRERLRRIGRATRSSLARPPAAPSAEPAAPDRAEPARVPLPLPPIAPTAAPAAATSKPPAPPPRPAGRAAMPPSWGRRPSRRQPPSPGAAGGALSEPPQPPRPPPPRPPPRWPARPPEVLAAGATRLQAGWRALLARRLAGRLEFDQLRRTLGRYTQALEAAAAQSASLAAVKADPAALSAIMEQVGPVVADLGRLVAGLRWGAHVVAAMREARLLTPLIALLEVHARTAEPALLCAGLAVITNTINFGGEDLLRPTRCFPLLLVLVHSDDEGVQYYAAAALQNILTDPHVGNSAEAMQALREAGVDRRLAALAALSAPRTDGAAARGTLVAKAAAGALINVRTSKALRQLVSAAQLQRAWRRMRRRAPARLLPVAVRRELRARRELAASVRSELSERLRARRARAFLQGSEGGSVGDAAGALQWAPAPARARRALVHPRRAAPAGVGGVHAPPSQAQRRRGMWVACAPLLDGGELRSSLGALLAFGGPVRFSAGAASATGATTRAARAPHAGAALAPPRRAGPRRDRLPVLRAARLARARARSEQIAPAGRRLALAGAARGAPLSWAARSCVVRLDEAAVGRAVRQRLRLRERRRGAQFVGSLPTTAEVRLKVVARLLHFGSAASGNDFTIRVGTVALAVVVVDNAQRDVAARIIQRIGLGMPPRRALRAASTAASSIAARWKGVSWRARQRAYALASIHVQRVARGWLGRRSAALERRKPALAGRLQRAWRARVARRADFEDTAQYATWLEIPREEWAERSIWHVALLCRHTPKPDEWEQHADEHGEHYFHNTRTGATQWDHPVWLDHRKLYVAAKQKVDARRQAELAASKRLQAAARGRAGPELNEAVREEPSRRHSAAIVLQSAVRRRQGRSAHTVNAAHAAHCAATRVQAAQRARAGRAQAARLRLEREVVSADVLEWAAFLGIPAHDTSHMWIARQAQDAAVPEGWEVHVDEKSNEPYYHHVATGETSWDHPVHVQLRELYAKIVEREATSEAVAAAKQIQAGARGRASRKRAAARRDARDRARDPRQVSAAIALQRAARGHAARAERAARVKGRAATRIQARVRGNAARRAEMEERKADAQLEDWLGMPAAERELGWVARRARRKPLPAGWSEHIDAEGGERFYHNAATGATQWDNPALLELRARYARDRAEEEGARVRAARRAQAAAEAARSKEAAEALAAAAAREKAKDAAAATAAAANVVEPEDAHAKQVKEAGLTSAARAAAGAPAPAAAAVQAETTAAHGAPLAAAAKGAVTEAIALAEAAVAAQPATFQLSSNGSSALAPRPGGHEPAPMLQTILSAVTTVPGGEKPAAAPPEGALDGLPAAAPAPAPRTPRAGAPGKAEGGRRLQATVAAAWTHVRTSVLTSAIQLNPARALSRTPRSGAPHSARDRSRADVRTPRRDDVGSSASFSLPRSSRRGAGVAPSGADCESSAPDRGSSAGARLPEAQLPAAAGPGRTSPAASPQPLAQPALSGGPGALGRVGSPALAPIRRGEPALSQRVEVHRRVVVPASEAADERAVQMPWEEELEDEGREIRAERDAMYRGREHAAALLGDAQPLESRVATPAGSPSLRGTAIGEGSFLEEEVLPAQPSPHRARHALSLGPLLGAHKPTVDSSSLDEEVDDTPRSTNSRATSLCEPTFQEESVLSSPVLASKPAPSSLPPLGHRTRHIEPADVTPRRSGDLGNESLINEGPATSAQRSDGEQAEAAPIELQSGVDAASWSVTPVRQRSVGRHIVLDRRTSSAMRLKARERERLAQRTGEPEKSRRSQVDIVPLADGIRISSRQQTDRTSDGASSSIAADSVQPSFLPGISGSGGADRTRRPEASAQLLPLSSRPAADSPLHDLHSSPPAHENGCVLPAAEPSSASWGGTLGRLQKTRLVRASPRPDASAAHNVLRGDAGSGVRAISSKTNVRTLAGGNADAASLRRSSPVAEEHTGWDGDDANLTPAGGGRSSASTGEQEVEKGVGKLGSGEKRRPPLRATRLFAAATAGGIEDVNTGEDNVSQEDNASEDGQVEFFIYGSPAGMQQRSSSLGREAASAALFSSSAAHGASRAINGWVGTSSPSQSLHGSSASSEQDAAVRRGSLDVGQAVRMPPLRQNTPLAGLSPHSRATVFDSKLTQGSLAKLVMRPGSPAPLELRDDTFQRRRSSTKSTKAVKLVPVDNPQA